ncbi:MAG: C25 family cysteine peptidase [Candidatus Brocadiia bacterium]
MPARKSANSGGVPYGVLLWVFLVALVGLSSPAGAGEVNLRFTYASDDVILRPEGEFTRVALRGRILPEDTPGHPWLPADYVNVLIPAGARPTGAQVTAAEALLAEDLKAYPVQPPSRLGAPPPVFVPPKAEAYRRRKRTPARQATIEQLQHLRGYSIVTVRLNPVRYLPAAGKLYLSKILELKLTYAEGPRPASVRRTDDRKSADLVSTLVANPEDVASFGPTSSTAAPRDVTAGDGAQYLVVTSAALADAFQGLADRREAQGFSTAVVTVEAIESGYEGQDTQEKIRNCVTDYYANHATRYVVLGGDDSIVPDRDCYVTAGSESSSNMPTDLYYGALDGTWDADGDGVFGEAGEDDVDLLPEVWVGRIPVRTAAQATDYINKVGAYESASADGYSDQFLLTGVELWDTYSGDSVPSDFSDHEPVSDSDIWLNRLHRETIQPARQPTFLGKLFDTRTTWDASAFGDYPVSAGNIAACLNEGYHHVLMSTHGGTTVWATESGSYFSSSTAQNLTNIDRPNLIYTIACSTGAFDSAEPSLSEAFLRNPEGGAVAYMGSSRYGWGSPGSSTGGTSFTYARQFYTELLENGYPVLGEAFGRHKMALASSCSSNGSYRWVQFGLSLQGDPAIRVHGQEPGRAIHVDVPNGLEHYPGGGPATLRWCAGGSGWSNGDEVQLEYSPDNGVNWQTVPGAEAVSYDAASFEWTELPEGGTSECRLRASAVDAPSVNDESDGSFSIAEPLVVLTDALPTGTEQEPYEATLEASGGVPPYEWSVLGHEDLEAQQQPAPGTAQSWQADDGCWQYDLPFAFPFGGTSYSTVYVSSNGFLDFTSSSTDWSNSTEELAGAVRIAPLWDDLRTDGTAQAGEDIYIDQPGPGSVAFRWVAQTYSGANPVDFEVVLHHSGRIEFHYGAGNTGLSPTVGVSLAEERYLLSAHDGQSTLTEAESAVFAGLPEGLSLDGSTGQISGTPQESGVRTLRFYVRDSAGQGVHADLDMSIEGATGREETLVFGVNDADGIFRRVETTPENPGGTGWGRVPGKIAHISGGIRAVWGVNAAGGVWCRTGVSESNPSGTDWSQVPGTLVQISVGSPEVVWGVNAAGGIFCRVGITPENPTGSDWERVPGTLTQVSVGDGSVWGIGPHEEIWCRTGVSASKPTGDAWERVPGRLAQLSAGQAGAVWGVNSAGGVFVRNGVTPSTPTGTDWARVNGSLCRVAVNDRVVWGIGKNESIWYRTGLSESDPLGTAWERCPGTLRLVSIGSLLSPASEQEDSGTGDAEEPRADSSARRNAKGDLSTPAPDDADEHHPTSTGGPIETNAPRISVNGPSGTVSESLTVVSGRAEDAGTVRGVWVNGLRAVATSPNYATWEAVVPLSQGRTADDPGAENTLTVGAADVHGNYAEATATVVSVGEAGRVRKVPLDTVYRGCIVDGDVDTFQFEATAGTSVDITLDGAGQIELRDPWSETVEMDRKPLALPATGLYTLRVLPGGSEGRYELRITGKVPRSLLRTSAALSDPSDMATYSIPSVAGGTLTARAYSESGPLRLAVTDPAGRLLAEADGVLRGLSLPVTGEYGLAVTGGQGEYEVVCLATPPQPEAQRIEGAMLIRTAPQEAAPGSPIELTVVGAARNPGDNAVLFGGTVVEPESGSLRAGRGVLRARVPADQPAGECEVSFIAHGEQSGAATVSVRP